MDAFTCYRWFRYLSLTSSATTQPPGLELIMTYFGFLLRFLVIPILIFLGITYWDNRNHRQIKDFRNGRAVWIAIAVHIIVAVIYTTPWDNYLVATGVWYYDPNLVSGIKIGWVPIEEYIFFVLQSLLAGLWLLFLARRISKKTKSSSNRAGFAWFSMIVLGIAWVAS